ncbi:hypothetical protein ENTB45_187 [Enterobacter phage Entb_45]|nr:hypothetical protein ENTB45_187 [Enterobacter phage Entb_45]
MIIKQLYLWKQNASWSDEDFVMFGIVVISLLCSAVTGIFTYFGLGIFGPWFLGSNQTVFLGWLAPVLTQFYFWGRWASYAQLNRSDRLNTRTGEIEGRGWFKWLKASRNKKREQQEMKLRERSVALGFANEIKKVTGGHKLV